MTLVKQNKRRHPWFYGGLSDWFDNDKFFADMPFLSETNVPAMNVKENDGHFEVELAIPGFSKDDIDVTLENDLLHVIAEKKKETSEDDEEGYTRREFSYNKFERRIKLPSTVDPQNEVKARYEDGILRLDLAKREEAMEEPKKRIDIA
jgi:HSP20 family protein